MSEESLAARLAALEDEHAIQRCLQLYCLLLDDKRFEDWSELFAEDAEWIIPGAHFHGRQEILAGLRLIDAGPPGFCKHLTFHAVIQLDGTSARSWADWTCLLRGKATAPWRAVSAGRYYDSFRKADGRWRFHSRIADVDEAHNKLPDLPLVPQPFKTIA